ncbi:cytoplasmic protein [Gordoniibacillus kamchatkensis]|uniref:Cytoplasmic protein n=2 Tax=Gordoniibacillus kamchatkensis TaxID=1590651 RepID=A0ABR5AMW9_9BACL|nr:DUF1697 domain-containing protein [Paenibacillus sp. VKM B-2647]KIL42354.1 cytoplasmic protein [Paenibacillus sp. VKM B-2647]
MPVYIALLRGINVGGKNMIKMAELKRSFEGMGLRSVQTYIQSGNVLFVSEEEEAALRTRIEQGIEAAFGLKVTVVLRTANELETVAANCPFSAEEIAAAEATCVGECLHVAFLPEQPAPEGVERLTAYQSDNDEFRIAGRDVFLLFRSSIRNSKLAANIHKLGVPATVRNWNTVNKLVALANTIEAGV